MTSHTASPITCTARILRACDLFHAIVTSQTAPPITHAPHILGQGHCNHLTVKRSKVYTGFCLVFFSSPYPWRAIGRSLIFFFPSKQLGGKNGRLFPLVFPCSVLSDCNRPLFSKPNRLTEQAVFITENHSPCTPVHKYSYSCEICREKSFCHRASEGLC